MRCLGYLPQHNVLCYQVFVNYLILAQPFLFIADRFEIRLPHSVLIYECFQDGVNCYYNLPRKEIMICGIIVKYQFPYYLFKIQ